MRMRLSEKQIGHAGRTGLVSLVLLGLVAGVASAGTVVEFQATNLFTTDLSGRTLYRIAWTVYGHTFLTNEQLDIRFDPALYGAISNGQGPAGFNVLLIQPDNPPGTFGDYKALSLGNGSSSTTAGFQADVFSQGAPVSQPFVINLLDGNGTIIATVDSGVTVTPEPATLPVVGMALFLTGAGVLWRRRVIARARQQTLRA